jgi:hypothetical protein
MTALVAAALLPGADATASTYPVRSGRPPA